MPFSSPLLKYNSLFPLSPCLSFLYLPYKLLCAFVLSPFLVPYLYTFFLPLFLLFIFFHFPWGHEKHYAFFVKTITRALSSISVVSGRHLQSNKKGICINYWSSHFRSYLFSRSLFSQALEGVEKWDPWNMQMNKEDKLLKRLWHNEGLTLKTPQEDLSPNGFAQGIILSEGEKPPLPKLITRAKRNWQEFF